MNSIDFKNVHFDGEVSYARTYDHALSGAEVVRDYLNGKLIFEMELVSEEVRELLAILEGI